MCDGLITLHQTLTQRSCKMSTKQSEVPRAQRELSMTSPKLRHERLKQRPNQGVVPRPTVPDHLRQRLRQQVPQAIQVLPHLLQLVLRRPSLHPSRCQHQQNHPGHLLLISHNQHLSTRRNALTDLIYFSSEYWRWLDTMWCTPSSLMNITKNDLWENSERGLVQD